MRIKGWKEVFKFTFTQQIKTKSFIIGTIVIALIVAIMAFLADFLPVLLLEDEFDKAERAANGEDTLTVDTLYIADLTDYGFDFSAVAGNFGLTYKTLTEEEADEKISAIADTSERAVVTKIMLGDSGFEVDSRYSGGESGVEKGDCEAINDTIATSVKAQYLSLVGVPEDELGLAMSRVSVSISSAGEEPTSVVKMVLNMVVPMISSLVLFIFIFSYSQLVAQAVAIEKSSRIIEYLLTSIKPLAIILGKVLAMCCVSLLQFILIGLGGTFGFLISLPFGIFTKIDMIAGAAASAVGSQGTEAANIVGEISSAFSSVDAGVFVIMFATFILGFLFFAGIAGLAGASISKMEDLSAAIQPLSLLGVLGFYLAYMPQATGEENMFSVLARYVPISSPFVLSSDYLLGKIGIGEALISIAILIAADILVMMLVAKVYESVILHTGNRLKLSDMLKMSK